MKFDFKALSQNTSRLPSPPGIAAQIVQLAHKRDVEIQEIQAVISRDPALTSKILRFANSPLYSVQQEVESLRRALVVMGLNTAINLSLSFSLLDSLQKQQGKSLDYQLFWKRSLLSATIARELGEAIGELAREELFLAGLLQDLGMLVIDRVYPDFYDDIGEDQVYADRLHAYEREKAGMDHAEVGGWLLRKWSYAERTEQAVSASHDIKTYPSNHNMARFARCVALSGRIADLFITEDSAHYYGDIVSDASTFLGIDRSQVDEILLKFSTLIPELETLFEIPMKNCGMPSTILEQANEALMLRNLETLRSESGRQRTPVVHPDEIKVDDDAATDGLTGIFSRYFLERYLQEMFARCERTGMPLSMALAVLDNFQPINNKYGRSICEEILQETAELLEGSVRAGDVVARYGDEVFAITFPGLGKDMAHDVCERIATSRRSLSHRVKLGKSVPITLSMGVVTHDKDTHFADVEAFLETVTNTLYNAKLQGDNALLQHRTSHLRTVK